jgi:hypothetical protein
MLGAYTMEKLCTDCGGYFRCFIRDILNRHLKMEAPVWLADHSKHREMKTTSRKRMVSETESGFDFY